ncbi:Nuclear pore complex protein Nup98-Nup96 [Orchesella cincta]|uniref:Nuclear pore complex protein Nup98-Nup96 n=1 Tax=Orchesella cincta TaxID=48709 RepID=A0A1D2MUD6_ORCCI|nr:Nuclear pore complex protein Nup98-Nup96 [Orchesella cincta]
MFGSGGFGSTPSTFGGGGFGTTANTGASVFGQPAQPQPPTSLFGGGTSTFGAQQTLPAFGAGATAAPATAFGAQAQTSSVFGQQARPTTGIFSNTATTISPFSTQTQVAGTSIPFNAITGTDTMMKNGAASQINTRHQCITCMKEYENKSLEELRLEDYQMNRKGPQNSMFGAQPTQQAQPGGGLFSGIGATSTAGASTFGQTPAFGQTTTSGGLFGSALNQSKPGGFFGSGAAPTTSGFGAGSSLGFSFSNPTSQPQQSIFGANNNTATSSTTGGLGTTSFSFSQPQQQQQGLSLFSQKPLATPVSSAPAFGAGGFGSAATNTTMTKPLFGGTTGTSTFGNTGTAAPTFGTGSASLFSTNTQQQAQAKPFSFSTPFSSAPQTSQPTFGGTTGTSTFNFSNPVSTPTVNFGAGTGAAPAFGAGTTTGSTFAPLTFSSLGGGTQTQQPGAAPTFGSGFFSSNTNTSTTGGTTGLSLFNPGGSAGSTFNTGGLQFQQQQMQLQQQQQHQQLTGNISFATTPYKDSQLFYNLISNRKVDDMTKPTNPTAQRQFREASRRKTSTSAGISTSLNLNSSAALKNLTFPTSRNRNSISKFQIFDGFEDEDRSIGVDILSPKTNVKKLVIKSSDISTPSTPRGGGGKSLLGITPLSKSLNSSGFQSPNNIGGLNRRNRLTLNSTLNHSDLSFAAGDNGGVGEPNRTLDFGESSLLSETSRNEFGHGHGEGNGNGGESYANGTNGPYNSTLPSTSKRNSEVDVMSPRGIGTGAGGGGGSSCEGSPYVNGSLNDSIPGTVCGVICTRPGYYVKPSVEELDRIMDQQGNCVINAFEVGRHNFGKIKFILPVNVANLNIDEIVLFRHKEVVVYPDDNNKPPLGQGLNVAAEIELERVWPIDKATNDAIRSPRKIKAMNYDTKLKRACTRLDADFISYNEEAGIWKFKVNHFSKYSCDLEENEEDDVPPPPLAGGIPPGMPQQMGKGLGGIPLSQQHKLSLQQRMSGQHQPGPGGDASPGMSSVKTLSLVSSPPQPSHFTVLAPPPSSQDAHQFQMLEGGMPPQSDVELNPLTPCDSDDDDDDDDDDDEEEEDMMVRHRQSSLSSRPMLPKYKAVLKDAGTEKSRLMKSVMSIDEFYEEDGSILESTQSQPPIKKSRATIGFSAQSFASSNDYPEVEHNVVQRLKGRLTADPQQLKELNKSMTPTQSTGSSSKPQQQTIMQVVKPEEFLSVKEKDSEDLFSSLRSSEMRNNVKLQGCPRVCFLPSGHFLTVNQTVGASGFSAELKISQLSSYADKQEHGVLAGPIRAVLETQMENRLKMEGVLFKDHIEAIRAELPNCNIPKLRETLEQELVLWQLCDILWPEQINLQESALRQLDDAFLLTQRHNLSNWLRNNSAILFGDVYKSQDRSILGLLKKGLLEKACEEAVNQGNFFMSVLLASEPHLHLNFEECSEIVDEGMPASTADIFSLISGSLLRFSELTPEKVAFMTTNDWLQYFALYIWYSGPTKSSMPIPVDKAVREYEEMMRDIVGDENCLLPTKETSTIANLCMHLLKMYSCNGYPMSYIYCPRTWTSDCLDYKLVWLLMRDLEAIGYLPSSDLYPELCLSFAGELECIGLWKWAHYVIREIEPAEELQDDEDACERLSRQRDAFCVRLIERNVDKLEGPTGMETEKFLVYDLGTDERLLYSIKSWKTERVDEKIWYLGRMDEWAASLNTLINYLTEANIGLSLIPEKNAPGFARNMLEHLEILKENCKYHAEWEVHGKMLYNYLTMTQFQQEEQESEVLETAVTNFLESVIKVRPTNPNQCAFLLEMAISAQKVVQLLFVQPGVNNKENLYERLQQFLDIPVPKEFFEGLRCFINQNMRFMVDMFNPNESLPFAFPPSQGVGVALMEN